MNKIISKYEGTTTIRRLIDILKEAANSCSDGLNAEVEIGNFHEAFAGSVLVEVWKPGMGVRDFVGITICPPDDEKFDRAYAELKALK